jgi:hypothetical protein
LQHVLELDVRQVRGNAVGKLRDQGAKGNKGQKDVIRAILNRVESEANLEGQILRLFDSDCNQALEFEPGEWVSIGASPEGIEIAGRGAGSTGAKFVIAVNTTAIVVAHRPVSTAGDGTARLVWVSGHVSIPLIPL